ncbi:hypothetical protein PUN28_002797 [Cardiocondyla obscurior]|uniref:Uncharacterized protein n=1 Tax=Cardiocondyla obscurior TaxID=286306 RepID=A0AAW2GWG6_9HYME
MSAACRFAFECSTHHNFTSVFFFCQQDRFLFQICVMYSSASRLLHSSVVPPRRVISGADYRTTLKHAFIAAVAKRQSHV